MDDEGEIITGSDKDACHWPYFEESNQLIRPAGSRIPLLGAMDGRRCGANGGTLVLRGNANYLVFIAIIDAEFFVVVKNQLANDRAEGDLRCFHVHLIEDFLDLAVRMR